MSQDIPDSQYIESPGASDGEFQDYDPDTDSDSLADPTAQIEEASQTLMKTLLHALNHEGVEYLNDDTNLKDTIYQFKFNDIGKVIPYPPNWCHQLLGQTISIFPDEWIKWLEDNYGRVYAKLTEGFEEFYENDDE